MDCSFLILCALLGIVQVWITRHAMNSDGISYLDIGDAYFRGDWTAAVNGYWSPMYSWWLGLVLHLVKPSLRWEFVAVHLVNLIIYFVALLCFRFFIHSVLHALREGDEARGDNTVVLPDWVFLGLSYSIFLWAALVLIDPAVVTPDLLVAAIVFLIGGYLVDLRIQESYWRFGGFGLLCGAAYLSKAIMFPLGFGFLGILLLSGKRSRRRVYGVLLSGLLFLMVSLPFIASLSKAKGRLTFGDSGRLSYTSLVSPGSPQTHWQGEPAGSGTPRHTTRRLLEHPPVFEFAEPVGGTYPPWYDPSYWNDGVVGHFRLRSQLRVLIQGARTYASLLVEQSGLLAGVLVFLLVGGAPTRRAIVSNWPLIAAACLSIGVYALVLVRTRYVGASIVLLLVAILAGIRLPENERSGLLLKYVPAAVMATILFAVVGHLAETAYTTLTVGASPSQEEQMEAAVGLEGIGLQAGDRVAVIGDGMTNFWARLGRFKIVSEVYSPDPGNRVFWAMSWKQRNSAYECLGRSGARLVVVWNPPANDMDPGWKQISNTNYTLTSCRSSAGRFPRSCYHASNFEEGRGSNLSKEG
jgi:hypothetical protein